MNRRRRKRNDDMLPRPRCLNGDHRARERLLRRQSRGSGGSDDFAHRPGTSCRQRTEENGAGGRPMAPRGGALLNSGRRLGGFLLHAGVVQLGLLPDQLLQLLLRQIVELHLVRERLLAHRLEKSKRSPSSSRRRRGSDTHLIVRIVVLLQIRMSQRLLDVYSEIAGSSYVLGGAGTVGMYASSGCFSNMCLN